MAKKDKSNDIAGIVMLLLAVFIVVVIYYYLIKYLWKGIAKKNQHGRVLGILGIILFLISNALFLYYRNLSTPLPDILGIVGVCFYMGAQFFREEINSKSQQSQNYDRTYAGRDESRDREKREERSGGHKSNKTRTETIILNREMALKTLRLEDSATPEDVKKAYRELSKQYHPDKYQFLGDKSAAAAEVLFVQINSAYEYLIK